MTQITTPERLNPARRTSASNDPMVDTIVSNWNSYTTEQQFQLSSCLREIRSIINNNNNNINIPRASQDAEPAPTPTPTTELTLTDLSTPTNLNNRLLMALFAMLQQQQQQQRSNSRTTTMPHFIVQPSTITQLETAREKALSFLHSCLDRLMKLNDEYPQDPSYFNHVWRRAKSVASKLDDTLTKYRPPWSLADSNNTEEDMESCRELERDVRNLLDASRKRLRAAAAAREEDITTTGFRVRFIRDPASSGREAMLFEVVLGERTGTRTFGSLTTYPLIPLPACYASSSDDDAGGVERLLRGLKEGIMGVESALTTDLYWSD